VSNIEKSRSLLVFQPRISIEAGIRRTIQEKAPGHEALQLAENRCEKQSSTRAQ
jgi:hypothetical protein